MKLQRHKSRKTKKGEDYFKYELILPKKAIEISKFKEGQELKFEAKEGEIKLKKK
jgi:hypothetical protein